MMSPPTIAPATDSKPAQDQHGQRLQRDEGQRELHAVARAPHEARDQRHESRHRPHDRPDLPQRNADGERRLMVVGDGAQRAADARRLEEYRQRGNEDAGDDRREHVELADVDVGVFGKPLHRLVRDPELETVRLRPPEELRESFQDERQPDRRHEQRDLRLVDQWSQHKPLDRDSRAPPSPPA